MPFQNYGRPKFLTDEKLRLARWMSRAGLTQGQIAVELGMTRRNFERHLAKNETLREAVKEGRQIVDFMVEDALLKRALGFDVVETHVTESDEGTETKTIRKKVHPDPTSMIFWLKNRKRVEWGVENKLDAPPAAINPTSSLPPGFNPANLSDDDALKLFELLRRATLPAPSGKLAAFTAANAAPVTVEATPCPAVPLRRGRGRPRKVLTPIDPETMAAMGTKVT